MLSVLKKNEYNGHIKHVFLSRNFLFLDCHSIINLHANKKKKTQSKGIMDIMEEKLKYEAQACSSELEMRWEQMNFEFDMRRRQMELDERRMHLQEAQQLQDEECRRECYEDRRPQQ